MYTYRLSLLISSAEVDFDETGCVLSHILFLKQLGSSMESGGGGVAQ
jgi:hypothetical protein